jgi:hypothetical protein
MLQDQRRKQNYRQLKYKYAVYICWFLTQQLVIWKEVYKETKTWTPQNMCASYATLSAYLVFSDTKVCDSDASSLLSLFWKVCVLWNGYVEETHLGAQLFIIKNTWRNLLPNPSGLSSICQWGEKLFPVKDGLISATGLKEEWPS